MRNMAGQAFPRFGTENDEICPGFLRHTQDLLDGVSPLYAKQREAVQVGRRRDQLPQLLNDLLLLAHVVFHVQEGNSRAVLLGKRKSISSLSLGPESESGRKQNVLQFNSVKRLAPHIGSD